MAISRNRYQIFYEPTWPQSKRTVDQFSIENKNKPHWFATCHTRWPFRPCWSRNVHSFRSYSASNAPFSTGHWLARVVFNATPMATVPPWMSFLSIDFDVFMVIGHRRRSFSVELCSENREFASPWELSLRFHSRVARLTFPRWDWPYRCDWHFKQFPRWHFESLSTAFPVRLICCGILQLLLLQFKAKRKYHRSARSADAISSKGTAERFCSADEILIFTLRSICSMGPRYSHFITCVNFPPTNFPLIFLT